MGEMSVMLSPKPSMISCHPVNPKARIIVLLGWGRGRGRGSYIPPLWEGGGSGWGRAWGG